MNLIGDHTDYTGGLALPLAIDRFTEVRGERGGSAVALRSDQFEETAKIRLDIDEPAAASPEWARYAAGVVTELRPETGFVGTITSDIPLGVGLSSSAALEVALALALGFDGDALGLARLCQRAELAATGTPTGIMDQFVTVFGVAGHALEIDCAQLVARPIALPVGEVDIVVVPSGETRELGGAAGAAYADRVAACQAAEAQIGPLRAAKAASVADIDEPVVRRRARHVITENQRVRAFVAALVAGDVAQAGQIMTESHASMRDDYEVSTPTIDALVRHLISTRGVYGARLTGAGFGGCVVALCAPGALGGIGWTVQAVDGAGVAVDDG